MLAQDHKSSQSFWNGIKVQPIMADEVQTFKALQTIHKVLQEGHPVALKEAQQNVQWLESLNRGLVGGISGGDGLRGYAPLIQEYIHYFNDAIRPWIKARHRLECRQRSAAYDPRKTGMLSPDQ